MSPSEAQGFKAGPSEMVQEILDRLRGVRGGSNGQWTALCPAHPDREPSLSIGQGSEGKPLLKCHGPGCSYEAIMSALGIPRRTLTPTVLPVDSATLQPPSGLTVEALAAAKRLPAGFLKQFGVSDFKWPGGAPAVKIEYPGVAGEVAAMRYRLALTGDRRFKWRAGSKVMLYPLSKLAAIRQRGWCLIGEGESDAWTAWLHDIPFLGVPGKGAWQDDWAALLDGVALTVWQEPDAEDFAERVARRRPDLAVIERPPFKDLSEAHIAGEDVSTLVDRLRHEARPWAAIQADKADTRRAELLAEAQPVLAHPDPLRLVEDELRRQGYGGDLAPALIVYLAVTSRLLAMRPGNMPVHLLLVGTSSAGKSYTVGVVLRLLPPDASYTITAGSPRALIYDDAPLSHRALIFGEADSLPADEDNPAASAIRSLLQEHQLHYEVVERTSRGAGGEQFVTRHIRRPGPTVMITTSTRRLPGQLDTRVFSLDLPEDLAKIRAALKTQAQLSRAPAPAPDPSLVAFQALLQTRVPWDVDVPYLERLAVLIGQAASNARLLRDFSRLTAFIQAVAVLRHARRATDPAGRVVATLEDYDTVRRLVGAMYAESASGASEGVRGVVQAVTAVVGGAAGGPCNLQRVCGELGGGVNKGSVSRWVRAALEYGWLVNRTPGKQIPYDLIPGEPIPEWAGLPDTALLAEADDGSGCGVAGLTGSTTTSAMALTAGARTTGVELEL